MINCYNFSLWINIVNRVFEFCPLNLPVKNLNFYKLIISLKNSFLLIRNFLNTCIKIFFCEFSLITNILHLPNY